MDTDLIIGLSVLAVLLVAAVAVAVAVLVTRAVHNRRRLRRRFGPEYDRAVQRHHSRTGAERELRDRERHHSRPRPRDLTSEARAHYEREWTRVQEWFVDDPARAVADTDRLLTQLMAERGYPVDAPEQRDADLSVEHAHTVEDYRRARELVEYGRVEEATTEELRAAMVRYRALFADLLDQAALDEGSAAERHSVPGPRDTTDRDTPVEAGRRGGGR